MKTTFIHILGVAILATSVSAFAVTNDGKPAETASPCASSKQDAAQQTNQSKQDKKSKKQKDQKQENNDQFMGIWG